MKNLLFMWVLSSQVMGQEEVKEFLSSQIQLQMELRHQHGRCQFPPNGPAWKDLLDSISELLSHHLQQVVLLFLLCTTCHVLHFTLCSSCVINSPEKFRLCQLSTHVI